MNGEHLTFEVFGHPEPAGSKTNMPRRRFPVTLHSMRDFMAAFPLVDANTKSKGWKEKVAQSAAAAMLRERLDLIDGPVFVEMVFTRARPVSHLTQKGLSSEGRRQPWPDTKPDVLKLARGVEDACTGIVWRDDARIVKETLRKEWGDIEGVTVTIFPLETSESGTGATPKEDARRRTACA